MSSDSNTTFEPTPLSQVEEIASKNLITSPSGLAVEIGQARYRVGLLNSFQIAKGSRVLEIGCGQGTCTIALAHYVGPDGHVDAIDPASPDYGAPYTLRQAQEHLKKGEYGSRMTFHCANVEDFLREAAAKGTTWDSVVFVHCIWYFMGEDVLLRMMRALHGRAKQIYIAEHSLEASQEQAVPHVLAAMTRAAFEAHDENSAANIRCLMTGAAITTAAQEAGWALAESFKWIPEEDVLDGSWEVGDVKREGFVKDIDEKIQSERVKTMLKSSRQAVIARVKQLDGKKVRTMDAWGGKFVAKEAS